MEIKKLKDINEYSSQSVNPSKSPDIVFEVYSVPSHADNKPEYLRGDEIGSTKVVIEEGDILLCKINPRINRVWVVDKSSEHLSVASSEWIVVRSKENNPEYLAWYFRSDGFKTRMNSGLTGIGGSLTRAQPKRVADYPVPIRERKEQDEIVLVLNKVNKIIDSRKEQLEQMDNLIKSRFVEMFGDPLSNPMGWEEVVITELCEKICGGGTPSKSHPEYFVGRIPWVSPKDMKSMVIRDSQDHITEEAIKNSSTKIIPENSVLMVIRSGILKHTLPVAINAVPVTINQDMKAFIPGKKILTTFLMNYFKAIEPDVLSGVRGVTADNIDFKDFQKRLVILPPIEIQKQFANFVQQVNKLKIEVQKSLDEAQVLFDSLMQEYFE